MPLTVHIYYQCPYCRPVLMLDRYLGLGLNFKDYNIWKKEHLVPEFLKINPRHTVPTVEDEDFIVWESPIVLQYLADKFSKDDSLFPKDLKKRTKVQFRIQFVFGTLLPRLESAFETSVVQEKLEPSIFNPEERFCRLYMELLIRLVQQKKGNQSTNKIPLLLGRATAVDPEKLKSIHEALGWLDNFLKEDKYAADDSVTIADFALASAVANFEYSGVNLSSYGNIQRWFSLAKKLKGYERSMTDGFEEKPKITLE